jgi:hypothetical protein
MMKAISTVDPVYEKIDDPNKTFSLDEFLEQKKDYHSVLLIATKTRSQDRISLLLVNTGASYIFDDQLTTNGQAISVDGHYLQVMCKNLAEGMALRTFIYAFLTRSEYAEMYSATKYLSLVGWLFTGISVFTLIDSGHLPFQSLHIGAGIIDVFLLLFAVLFIWMWIIFPKRGLRIQPRVKSRDTQIKNIIKGKFNENLLVRLLVTLLGTVLGGIILAIMLKMANLD